MLLKREQIFRAWNPDRVLRGRRTRADDLQRRVERAHAAGFSFPMRIFLAAERRVAGMLRERFLICEFIEGKPAPRVPALVEAVRRAHGFGICWGGDPNPGNFLEDARGRLRGVDIAFPRATWRERGKDLDAFFEEGLLAGTPPLCVRVSRLQAAVKDFLRLRKPSASRQK